MCKKLFLFFGLLLLSNCSTPTSAFLGPIFTGAKTGSLYQASLSYSGNRIVNKIREIHKEQYLNLASSENVLISTFARNPIIMNSYKIYDVEFSDVVEPEPLP